MDSPQMLDEPREFCGVFGMANHPMAVQYTRLGLYALQHRGQESAGIMARSDAGCVVHKGMGLVADVFKNIPANWADLNATQAIGHVRYSTSGSSAIENAQPIAVEFDRWHLGLAHNGNLSNGGVLREHLKQTGAILQGTTDTEIILHLGARHHHPGDTPWKSLQNALRQVEGAYSLLAQCEDGLAAMRDPFGFRPLAMGHLDGAVVFASETSAFDIIGATYERDVKPGEFILVRPDGTIESRQFDTSSRRAHCVFELVYFSRPDSRVFNENVYQVRKRFGARMALESPVEADVVMPVPDGGVYAALGFAEASGIPFDMGIMRNHYVGRTFIQPTADARRQAVNVKLNPIPEAIEGKRVVLIDDSIVRGNTAVERVRLLRKCGAKEVHMRISCPPHKHPCYYGIDFPNPQELMANRHTLEEIRDIIKVDSLAYLSLDGMMACISEQAAGSYCHACFSGLYPVAPKLACKR